MHLEKDKFQNVPHDWICKILHEILSLCHLTPLLSSVNWFVEVVVDIKMQSTQ